MSYPDNSHFIGGYLATFSPVENTLDKPLIHRIACPQQTTSSFFLIYLLFERGSEGRRHDTRSAREYLSLDESVAYHVGDFMDGRVVLSAAAVRSSHGAEHGR